MEVEIKLSVAEDVPGGPEAFFTRLASLDLIAGLPLGPSRRHDLRDVYYDVEGGTLARMGSGLRLRVQDGERYVTLKVNRSSDGALTRREEYEEPLSQESLNRVLAHVHDRLGPGPFPSVDFGNGRPCGSLAPVLDVRTARLTRSIGQDALLVLDKVTYVGVLCGPFYDIEVEARPGAGAEPTLRKVETELTLLAQGGLFPAGLSKLERGRRLLAMQ